MSLFLLNLFLISQGLFAEYRVFLLQMTGADGKVMREFPSTLDPLQYPFYYPLPQGVKLLYSNTWMCPGDTADFKPLCAAPPPPAPKPPDAPQAPLSSPPQTAP